MDFVFYLYLWLFLFTHLQIITAVHICLLRYNYITEEGYSMSEPFDYGHFDIVLAEYLQEKKVSKNRLAEEANLQRTQLNAY